MRVVYAISNWNCMHRLLVSISLDVLLVTEPWLTPEYSSYLLSDPKCYSVLRNDRLDLLVVAIGQCAAIKYGIDLICFS